MIFRAVSKGVLADLNNELRTLSDLQRTKGQGQYATSARYSPIYINTALLPHS